ncbi:hypothetical protein Tco_0241685 [Tanacetum coccineum]
MSAITDIKCVLSQKAFDAFCEKFHIPEEVHPVLPSRVIQCMRDLLERLGYILEAPVAADFNAQDYATLAAHPSSFWKFPEAFLCLVGLSRYYPLDEETYPWFLHKNREGGLFDAGGSGNQAKQGESTSGREGANIQPVVEVVDTAVEDVAPVQPKR